MRDSPTRPTFRSLESSRRIKPLAFLAAIGVSLLTGVFLLLEVRYSKQIDSIRYPLSDELLLRMSQEDLSKWAAEETATTTTTTEPKEAKRRFMLSGPSSIPTAYNGKFEIVLVRFSSSRGISYLTGPDHLRLLWFTCSFRRIAAKLRRLGMEVDTYFLFNWGDYYTNDTTDVPVLSKAAPAAYRPGTRRNTRNLTVSDRERETRDVMIPYEELLWNYPLQFDIPWEAKVSRVVYRGSCTNEDRVEMVRRVRDMFPPPRSDVAVSCEPDFRPLDPIEQTTYRYLLDYDGEGYSRRLAWYLQTGSAILKGGGIDDAISRLAALVGEYKPDDAPMAFWRLDDGSMGVVLRGVIEDEARGEELAAAGLRFWRRYVSNGQAIWDGYLAHIVVEHSRRFEFVVNESAFLHHQESTVLQPPHRIASFWGVGRCDIFCALVLNGATPTKDGHPNWGFILTNLVAEVFLIAAAFQCLSTWMKRRQSPPKYKPISLHPPLDEVGGGMKDA